MTLDRQQPVENRIEAPKQNAISDASSHAYAAQASNVSWHPEAAAAQVALNAQNVIVEKNGQYQYQISDPTPIYQQAEAVTGASQGAPPFSTNPGQGDNLVGTAAPTPGYVPTYSTQEFYPNQNIGSPSNLNDKNYTNTIWQTDPTLAMETGLNPDASKNPSLAQFDQMAQQLEKQQQFAAANGAPITADNSGNGADSSNGDGSGTGSDASASG